MSELRKKLVGKKVKMIQPGVDDWGVTFLDGSGFSINTKVETSLVSREGEAIVTEVYSSDEMIDIRLGKFSFIRILLDEELLDGPEFFVFRDADGTYIIEN